MRKKDFWPEDGGLKEPVRPFDNKVFDMLKEHFIKEPIKDDISPDGGSAFIEGNSD